MQNSSEDEHNMADRKRRRTPEGVDERDRDGAARIVESAQSTGAESSQRMDEEAPGSSQMTPVDLTEETERPLPPLPPSQSPAPPIRTTSRSTAPSTSRRQSDIVLPRWQPDTDVVHCPVCKNLFTFFYRKHHCRKCGRVVCANCSPHRITIPRQFIVRPPELRSAFVDLTGDESSASPSVLPQPQLWGGEEVRVCNPCVPDPNLSPPPQLLRSPSDQIPPEHWRFPSFDVSRPLPSLQPPPNRPRNTSGPLPPLPPLPPYAGHRSTHSAATVLASDLQRRSGQDPFRSQRHMPPYPSNFPNFASTNFSNLSNNNFYPRRTSSNLGASTNNHFPPPLAPYRTPNVEAPPPRRQVAEEDECPVCGEELPPKGPNGENADRERHVEQCIGAHLYTASPPPSSSRTISAPPGEVPSLAAEASSSSVSSSASAFARDVPMVSGSLPTISSLTPLRQRRMTGGRMLVYRAAEKDCVEEEGGRAECVICFEEFEEGDEMGRLECLCRFHRTCIRQWWDTKGMGSCPTHQLHD